MDTMVLKDVALPLVLAIVGIFSGAGFWSWKVKQAEIQGAHKTELLTQVDKLLAKIEELSDSKGELLQEIATLRSQLDIARNEISLLKGLVLASARSGPRGDANE